MKFYNDLPNWAKGVVAIGGVAIVGVFGYKIYQDVKRKRDVRDASKSADEATKELKRLSFNGVNPTITKTQAINFSEKLVQAMNGCGTDEKMVYSVFNALKNDADIYLLISSFGVRYYTPCGASQPVSYARWLFNDKTFGGDLGTWLSYDLSSSEIDSINNILSKKGIKYSF
ncbi:MAG: hypothetical protein EBR55_00235 [Chitinophagia bacterium]|jgi:hypothetical protein|nr:hypothetical protein [Chitinophagia bacterium]